MKRLGSSFFSDPREEIESVRLNMSLLNEEAEMDDPDIDEALMLSMPSSWSGSLWWTSILPA